MPPGIFIQRQLWSFFSAVKALLYSVAPHAVLFLLAELVLYLFLITFFRPVEAKQRLSAVILYICLTVIPDTFVFVFYRRTAETTAIEEAGQAAAFLLLCAWLLRSFLFLLVFQLQKRQRTVLRLLFLAEQAAAPLISLLLCGCLFAQAMALLCNGSRDIFSLIPGKGGWFLLYGILILNLFAAVLMVQLSLLHRRNINQQFQLESLKSREDYYRRIENSQQEIRQIRHDLKNQLLLFRSEGDGAESLIHEIRQIEETAFTKHMVINTLLNLKKQSAEKLAIDCHFDIQIPEFLSLDDRDACVLLGNLLDNAIEACQLLNDTGQRRIDLRLYYFKHSLLLKLQNSKLFSRHGLSTQKPDKADHGFGLKSVERIAEKYHGTLLIKEEEALFCVEVNLWEQ